ncbi:MAG: type I glyceraldehyde-3-phosphate dehydrogenase [Patescibacteria group bacterium]
MLRVAINGFGRIGRAAAKIILDRPNVELVALNDLCPAETQAHLLKYDTCYGIYDREVGFSDNEIIVNNKKIHYLSEKNPGALPWKVLDIDVVIESTGIFLTNDLAKAHLEAGAKKVVLSAPAKDDSVPTFVIGANADKYDDESIVSNASCTTNCIAPVMKVIEDEFGVEKSMMTTIHSYTADQNLVDGPHKDLRRARAAAQNIVPTTTGAAIAATLTIPKLKNKFDGLSIRVPSPVVSLSDIVAVLSKKVSVDDINEALKKAADGSHKGIIQVSEEPLVSSDLKQNPYSSIVDLPLTCVIGGDLVKIIAWYDNEWGYSERLVDMVERVTNSK